MSFAEVEKEINDYAKKAREGGLAIEDLQGGTLHHHQRRHLRLAVLHPDRQSAAERDPGHARDQGTRGGRERPGGGGADDVHRPVSYDHRIIDGKDAVLFLVDIKNQLENPHKMLLGI